MDKKRCLGCMREYESENDCCPFCGYKENTKAKELYHLSPGVVLQDRYIIGKVIGFGGFGITYIGFDTKLDKKMAVKEYLPVELATRMEGTVDVYAYDGEKTLQYRSGLTRFIEEALRLAKINHLPGIVHIFDSFAENNTAYIVMEYLEGETLKDVLKRRGTIKYQEAIEIAIPVLNSLDEVHKCGIIHRDIAPDNIMITDDGRVKLIDFGAARYATNVHSKSLSVILKPGYAPEEQYRSHGKQGPWSDVYAMGATLYRAITGQIPEEALERKVNDKLANIRKYAPDVTPECENAIMNALNVRAEDRIQTAKEFADALAGVSELERIKVKQKRADQGKWSLKMKIAVIASAVASVALVLVLLFNISNVFNNLNNDVERMPNIKGKSVEEAQSELDKYNIKLDKIGVKKVVGRAKFGSISYQNIPPGSSLDGVKVVEYFEYSDKHKNMIELPDFRGKTLAQAKKLLQKLCKKAGLKPNAVTLRSRKTTNAAGSYKVGEIVSQNPAYSKGLWIKKGTKITVTILAEEETTAATEATTQRTANNSSQTQTQAATQAQTQAATEDTGLNYLFDVDE